MLALDGYSPPKLGELIIPVGSVYCLVFSKSRVKKALFSIQFKVYVTGQGCVYLILESCWESLFHLCYDVISFSVPMASQKTVNPCDVVVLSDENLTNMVFCDVITLNLSISPQYFPRSVPIAVSFS